MLFKKIHANAKNLNFKLEVEEFSGVLPLNLVWSQPTITLILSENEGGGQD